MLGSQVLDRNQSFAGLDFGIPEVGKFGFAGFAKAVATTDDWSVHNGSELVFVLQGEACWELENEALVTISGGQYAVIPAGTRHRIVNGLYPPSLSFWLVMADPETPITPAILTLEGLRDFQGFLGRVGPTHPIERNCQGAISELQRLLSDPRIYSGSSLLKAEIRAQIHLVLVQAWRAQEKRSADRHNSELVDQFLEEINRNPDGQPNIAAIARKLGISRGRLHTRIREEAGMSPSDYAQRLRIKRCCQRLTTSDDSITDIGYDFGFASSQYFSRVFKKYLGATPSEYRKQMLTRGF